jgi:hypothetical protein
LTRFPENHYFAWATPPLHSPPSTSKNHAGEFSSKRENLKGTTFIMPITLNSDTGNIFAGGSGSDGDLVLRGTKDEDRIRLDAGDGNIWLGGNGADGDLVLFATSGDNTTLEQSTIHLDGEQANIFLGGHGADGDIVMRGPEGQDRIRLDAGSGNIWLGGNGADGDLVLFASSGDNSTLGQATIHLNGDAGDIILQNADCAEDFQIDDASSVEPGTVLVIGSSSRLQVCREAYDKRVAGVVAGAGAYRPGIILGRKAGQRKTSLPVALMGRVYCKVDSSHGAINVGDLLTTSLTPGHAMKARDPMKAFGAVIGKALEPISRGVGMIPILVALN